MASQNPNPGKRLSVEDKEEIIRLRLLNVPVREVARLVGCAPNTVTKVFREYLRERALEDPAGIEELRTRYVAESEAAAALATQQALRATQGDAPAYGSVAMLITAATTARGQAAKLRGLEQPAKVELSGEVVTEIRWTEEVIDKTKG